jgi:hypothetical protein
MDDGVGDGAGQPIEPASLLEQAAMVSAQRLDPVVLAVDDSRDRGQVHPELP